MSYHEEQEAEYKKYWESRGEPLWYIEGACEKCGRERVERWSNGDEVCEKCYWNKTKQKYEKGI